MNEDAIWHRIWAALCETMSCAWKPMVTISKLFNSYQEDKSLKSLYDIWGSALILCTIINYPILNLYGISWNNVGFYAPDELIILVSLVVTVIVTHLSLHIAKINSKLHEITILYTIVIIYSPITTLISLPKSFSAYAFIKAIKSEATADSYAAFKRLLEHNFWGDTGVSSIAYSNIIIYFSAFLSLLTLTAFAECVSQAYQSPRLRTYLAVMIAANLTNAVYQSVAFPLHVLIAYSAI